MKCVNHPEHEATEQCVFCKDVLCDDCAYEIGNKVYACGKCYDKYILKKAQPVQAPITTEVENQSLCCWHCNKKLSPTEVYKTTEYGQCYCDQCYNKLFDPTAIVSTSSTATSKKTSNKSIGTLFTAVVIISVIAFIIYVAYNSDYNKSIVEPQERLMTYSQLVSEADSLIESKERVKLTGYISDISSSFYHIDLYHGSQRFSALDIIKVQKSEILYTYLFLWTGCRKMITLTLFRSTKVL